MKVFLRISIVLVVLATVMVVLTVFEFKDNSETYKRPQITNKLNDKPNSPPIEDANNYATP